jgi:hypothetical protein
MWLVAALEGIERRTAIVHPEVAAWRNSAPDNPYINLERAVNQRSESRGMGK